MMMAREIVSPKNRSGGDVAEGEKEREKRREKRKKRRRKTRKGEKEKKKRRKGAAILALVAGVPAILSRWANSGL